jgi:hypothetical protein
MQDSLGGVTFDVRKIANAHATVTAVDSQSGKKYKPTNQNDVEFLQKVDIVEQIIKDRETAIAEKRNR